LSLGFGVLVIGSFAALLGAVATVNHTENCYVLPGPFPPCVATYQIPELATLYPLSAVFLALGIAAATVGAMLTFVGYSKRTPKQPSISPPSPAH
jgi:hypothetical protein